MSTQRDGSRVDLVAASADDRLAIAALLKCHLRELASLASKPGDVDGDGGVDAYPYFPLYWSDPDRFPFVFRAPGDDGAPLGFALVRRIGSGDDEIMEIAEFFVEPNRRRRGIGTAALSRLVERFPGSWSLTSGIENRAAVEFWRSVLRRLWRETLKIAASPQGGRVIFSWRAGNGQNP